MRKAASRLAEFRRGSPGWRFVAWVVVLAFTLQSFVTQTHIHWPPPGAATTIAKLFDGSSPQNKSPIEKDTTTCPFCQAIVHAGAFFTSAPPLLLLPVLWSESTIPRLFPAAVGAQAAHNWQSRAPPQH